MNPCKKCGASDRGKKGSCRPCKAKWYAENTEKVRANVAKWQAENPEKLKAADVKWKQANPERLRINDHNRRARKKANGGKLSHDLSKALYARQKGRCACCKKLLGDNYHLDHIVPLALGGANEDWNIQLLTATCNLNKGAKHPIDYIRSKGLLL